MSEEAKAILHGAIDTHMHPHPSHFPRIVNDNEAAEQARDLGMKAIVIKNHLESTVGRAKIATLAAKRIQVFGGITLNYQYGLNPFAVQSAIDGGAKIIWMPTLHAQNHMQNGARQLGRHQFFGSAIPKDKPGFVVWDDKKQLLPQIEEILQIIAEKDVILGTGHFSVQEQKALVSKARDIGVRKILIQHPTIDFLNYSLQDMIEVTSMGAYLEHLYAVLIGINSSDPHKLAEIIKEVGPEHCVLGTDGGAKRGSAPAPAEGIVRFVQTMLECGLTRQDIEKMIKTNPSYLLGIQ